jgi:hypothetical protein
MVWLSFFSCGIICATVLLIHFIDNQNKKIAYLHRELIKCRIHLTSLEEITSLLARSALDGPENIQDGIREFCLKPENFEYIQNSVRPLIQHIQDNHDSPELTMPSLHSVSLNSDI